MAINEIIKLAELLPKIDDLNYLIDDKCETKYIFELATNVIGKIIINYSEKNNMLPSEYEEEFYMISSLVDKSWEQINTGHFSKVLVNTRKIHAAAIYFKIIFLLVRNHDQNSLVECSQLLDKAILVGCTENLYNRNEDFVSNMLSFLDKFLGNEEINLPLIQPLEYKNVNCDIPVLVCPPVMIFKEYFDFKKPVLLKNTIDHWPALDKWRNLNYIMKIAGNRTVPVEIGKHYASEEWSQSLMSIKDFLIKQFGCKAMSNQEHPIMYLAQHDLFDQIPQLKDDIRVPDYCCLGEDDVESVNIKAWFGPCGTLTPMHNDSKHNILCQVIGSKKIILASCDDSDFLYLHENPLLKNTSQLDAENINFDEYPLARKVKFYHVLLQEKECIYIPPKWWHFVKSLSTSFSVSFWWT